MIWRRDLQADYGTPQGFFGYGPTPLPWQDRLIVNVGGKKAGGAGVWGPVPMPANEQVSDAEAAQLAAWVLAVK